MKVIRVLWIFVLSILTSGFAYSARFPNAVEKKMVLTGKEAISVAELFGLNSSDKFSISLKLRELDAGAIHELMVDTKKEKYSGNNNIPPRYNTMEFLSSSMPTLTISPYWLDLGTSLPNRREDYYSFSSPFVSEKLDQDEPWTMLVRHLKSDPEWKNDERVQFRRCFAFLEAMELCIEVYSDDNYEPDNKKKVGHLVIITVYSPESFNTDRTNNIIRGFLQQFYFGVSLIPFPVCTNFEKNKLIVLYDTFLTAQEKANSLVLSEDSLKEAIEKARKSSQIDRYLEQEVLLFRGCLHFEQNDFVAADAEFRSALAIAEAGLKILWTEKLSAEERKGYLPAYSNPEDERRGKYHAIANLHCWLAKVSFRRGNFALAQEQIDMAMNIIDKNLPSDYATVLEISLYELRAEIFETLKQPSEAQVSKEKAGKLKSSLQ